MSYANGKITLDEPVGIYDVQRALGSGSGSLQVLCRKNNLINKWSKRKPVQSPYPDYSGYKSTQTTAIGHYNPTWWRNDGNGKDCCIQLNVYNTIKALIDGWSTCWVYKGLRDTDSERLTDFNGYNRNAKSPISNFTYVGGIYMSSGDWYTTPIVNMYVGGDSDTNRELLLSDFFVTATNGQINLSQLYFGLVVVRPDGLYSIVTEESVIGTTYQHTINTWKNTDSALILGAGSNQCYPIFSDTAYTTPKSFGETDNVGCIIPFPASIFNLECTPYSSTFNWNAWFEDESGNKITSVTLDKSTAGAAYVKCYTKYSFTNKLGASQKARLIYSLVSIMSNDGMITEKTVAQGTTVYYEVANDATLTIDVISGGTISGSSLYESGMYSGALQLRTTWELASGSKQEGAGSTTLNIEWE